jgi:uncharacterized protein (DUF885 family)
MRRVAVCALLVAGACAHRPAGPSGPTPPDASFERDGELSSGGSEAPVAEAVDDPDLAAVVEDHWGWTLENFPELATRLGDHRYDDRLTDMSAEAIAARRRDQRAFLDRVQAISPAELSARDRTNRALLALELENDLAREVCRFELWTLSPRGNPITDLNFLPQAALRKDASGAADLLSRYRAAATRVDQEIANLRRGAAEGWFANAESTRRVLAMVDDQLAKPETEWPMYTEASRYADLAARGREAYLAELEAVLKTEIRPALERYRTLLADEVLPNARGDDAPGLASLPFGQACYAARIRAYTTLDLDASTMHRIGLDEIARINREMTSLGKKLFGHDELAGTLAELRRGDDPALYFDSATAIVEKAESALARARAAIPDWFGRLPEAECVVREIPAYEAPFTTVAYYRPAVPNGGRPGEYYVNTYQPETRTRYEAEALAFHESIPGHHLQIAIAQELEGMPEFRRHLGMTVFVEGWALYAESLSEEMGLYSGDLDRLGKLSYEAWRAARLVVDTGLHAMGWSRERAKLFMLEHTALAPNNIDNEVDRYIVWPGQALAYKTGQLEISRLRADAEAQLGDRFDVKAFHDVVLGGGAVSLPVLRDRVRSWVDARTKHTREVGSEATPASP